MTLTVRLNGTIEYALEQYCSEHGVTKTMVVQQSLAEYLSRTTNEPSPARDQAKPVNPLFQKLLESGFIGAGELNDVPADKHAVRARVKRRAGNVK